MGVRASTVTGDSDLRLQKAEFRIVRLLTRMCRECAAKMAWGRPQVRLARMGHHGPPRGEWWVAVRGCWWGRGGTLPVDSAVMARDGHVGEVGEPQERLVPHIPAGTAGVAGGEWHQSNNIDVGVLSSYLPPASPGELRAG